VIRRVIRKGGEGDQERGREVIEKGEERGSRKGEVM
jgi:hypothetical protein